MRDHTDIRRQLSSYLDGEVSGAERGEIEAHLAHCTGCREALAELERTVGLIRDLPRVEPPPWLAAKTMARVREQARPRPSLWHRLFFPLSVKLPLEAVALVLLCVTGYYLARNLAPQFPIVTPPAPREEARPETPAAAPQPSPSAPERKPSPPRPVLQPTAPPPEPRRPAPVPPAPPSAAPARPAPVEEFAPPPASLAPAPRQAAPAMETAPPPRPAAPAAPSYGAPPRAMETPPLGTRSADSVAPEKTTKRAKKAERVVGGGVPATALPRYEALLGTDDAAAAEVGVREAVRRAGGTVLRRETTADGPLLVVRVEGERLPDLVTRLERLGTLRRWPVAVAGGLIELTIRIETNR